MLHSSQQDPSLVSQGDVQKMHTRVKMIHAKLQMKLQLNNTELSEYQRVQQSVGSSMQQMDSLVKKRLEKMKFGMPSHQMQAPAQQYSQYGNLPYTPPSIAQTSIQQYPQQYKQPAYQHNQPELLQSQYPMQLPPQTIPQGLHLVNTLPTAPTQELKMPTAPQLSPVEKSEKQPPQPQVSLIDL
eukprot:NODE_953_length_2810_cov_0.269273.p2 type:complete len:184 gc:universal NODE_953_length_2810_cov_0.269273:1469-2020(+)